MTDTIVSFKKIKACHSESRLWTFISGQINLCWKDHHIFFNPCGGIDSYMCLCNSVNLSALSFPMQPIDYEGFQLFMVTYLENDIPEELCQHLFTSFKSKTGGCSPDQSRAGTSLLGRVLVFSWFSYFNTSCHVISVLNNVHQAHLVGVDLQRQHYYIIRGNIRQ